MSGYNATCGYDSSARTLTLALDPSNLVLPAYECASYAVPSFLSEFKFTALPASWTSQARR